MFRFCKSARIRRLSGRAPSTMGNSNTANRIKVMYHRGWSTHTTRERHLQAQPNRKVGGFCVTSGDLGTLVMHPPRKRNTRLIRHLQNHQQATSRSARADTAVRPYEEIFSSKVRSFVTHHASAFVSDKKAIRCQMPPVRESTAAGPNAELSSLKARSLLTSLTTRCAVEC